MLAYKTCINQDHSKFPLLSMVLQKIPIIICARDSHLALYNFPTSKRFLLSYEALYIKLRKFTEFIEDTYKLTHNSISEIIEVMK